MKRNHARVITAVIKTLGLLLLFVAFSWLALAWTTKKMVDDVWKQLGLTQKEGNINIRSSFMNGAFLYYGAKNAKNIVAGDRIAVIRELAAYAKKYTASDEFKKEYEAYRNRKRPAEPWLRHLSVDSLKAAERARIEKAIKDTEANANHPNPKVKNSVPYRLESLKKELAALDDPNNRKIKSIADSYQRSNDAAIKQYNEALKKFEAECPADPRVMIKTHLQKMLDITSDVDYAAELKQEGKFKVFVNPVYERKPKEWKLAYRAGKPATDALRAAAGQWLQELK